MLNDTVYASVDVWVYAQRRGISGGQRKRLSIAEQLTANYKVLPDVDPIDQSMLITGTTLLR